MKKLVLASANRGKLAELQAALAPLNWDLRPISDWTSDSPEESGMTFEANALIKARNASAISGLPSLADDSGLMVDALDGAPGVHSARYAGAAATDATNNEKLLKALSGVPDEQRTARFVCVIAVVDSAEDDNPLIARGEWHGRILQQPAGREGFGYDPLFFDPELSKSAAELARPEKLRRSHRGRAIRDLLQRLHLRR